MARDVASVTGESETNGNCSTGVRVTVSSSSGGGGATVTIADANLRAVIADSLDKARGAPITRAEMATLTRLDAPNKGIRYLTGLEFATNLQRLDLGRARVNDELVNSNAISNLSPLSNSDEPDMAGSSEHRNLRYISAVQLDQPGRPDS